MAETIISPGVFLQENDLSQITQGPIEVGAVLIGPTSDLRDIVFRQFPQSLIFFHSVY